MDQEATVNSTVVAGAGVGNTATGTGIKTRYQLVQGNTMLLHMDVDPPNVETVTPDAPGSVPNHRICIRSGVISK